MIFNGIKKEEKSGDYMKQIIFIEGLPGSGKTTFSKRLADYLNQKGLETHFYSEGDLHPVDLAWIAILSESDLEDLINKFPSLEEGINDNIKKFNDKYHLAYTRVKIDVFTKDFYDYCLQYEIYQSDDYNRFLEEHLNLWQEFLNEKKDDDVIYVFECIFLQNHINELLLKYDMSLEDINRYYQRFQEVLNGIDVFLIYIKQNDVEAIFRKITEERRTNDKALYKDWIDHVIDYFEKSKYGKIKGYIGYDGALRYFKERLLVELEVIKNLKCKKRIINLDNDYEAVFRAIINMI